MGSMLKRIFGLARIIVALASLLAGLVALAALWQARPSLAGKLAGGAQLVADTLVTTDRALGVAAQALQTTSDSTVALEQTPLLIGRAISETRPAVGSAANLVGEDLVSSVRAAQVTLLSTAKSASLVDDLLQSLSQIPLLGVNYAPEVSLSVSLERVAASVDGLPEALVALRTDLDASGANLGQASDSFTVLAAEIARLRTSLAGAEGVVAEYHSEVMRGQAAVARLRAALPGTITALAIVLSFLVYWLAVTQVREIAAGIGWLRQA
jgi:hypothetical protein